MRFCSAWDSRWAWTHSSSLWTRRRRLLLRGRRAVQREALPSEGTVPETVQAAVVAAIVAAAVITEVAVAVAVAAAGRVRGGRRQHPGVAFRA